MLDWLMQPAPHRTLVAMKTDGRLAEVLPEVLALDGVTQVAAHHPEIDAFRHLTLCLAVAERMNANFETRFAVLMHDLGKGLTPRNEWPKHVNHEQRGVEPVRAVCNRMKVSDYTRRLALLVCKLHLIAHQALDVRPQTVLTLFDENGFLDDPRLLEDFLTACEADKRGRLGKEDSTYPQGEYLRKVADVLKALPLPTGAHGESREWQDAHNARLAAVRSVLRQYAGEKGSAWD